MKRTILIVAAITLLLSVAPLIIASTAKRPLTWTEALEKAYGIPAYKTVDRAKSFDDQTALVKIAGRTFEFALIFIGSSLDKPGLAKDSVVLQYVLPDYSSRSDFMNFEEYEISRKAGHFGHMLLEESAIRPSFEEMLDSRRYSVGKIERLPPLNGLEREHWYYLRKSEGLVLMDDVYIEKDAAGQVVAWIDCNVEGQVTIPHCEHRFRHNKLLYDIHYHKTNYLARWREQRDSAIAFMSSHELSTSSQHPTKGD